MLFALATATARPSLRWKVTPKWRELWHIPLFCSAVLIFTATLYFFPPTSNRRGKEPGVYHKALLSIDMNDLDSAQRWLDLLAQDPAAHRTTPEQLHYARGSLLLAQARRRFPLPTLEKEAPAAYRAAGAELELANNKLPRADQARQTYRLLVAKIGADPIAPSMLDALEQWLDSDFIDRFDGYQLLLALRLKLDPPDPIGAVRAIDQLLLLPKTSQAHHLRLQKTQLLAQLGKWPEVVKAAASIPVDAPEYSIALQLQAEAKYHQQFWSEASQLWERVPAQQQTPRTLLSWGLCQQQLKNPSQAVKLWERLRLNHPGSPETIKALALLAHLAQTQDRWSDAVNLSLILLRTHTPKNSSPYLQPEELRGQLSQLAQGLISRKRWSDLRLLAEAALPWSAEGQVEAWLSQAWLALAQSNGTESQSPIPSRDAYKRAADYALQGAAAAPLEKKRDLLKNAGRAALQARAFPLAQRAFSELLVLAIDSQEKPDALLGLAEALDALGQRPDAEKRLREALQLPGKHHATVHLRLYAMLWALGEKAKGADHGQYSLDAERELDQAARLVSQPDPHPDAASAAHLWVVHLYRLSIINRSESLRAFQAGELALKHAPQHRWAAQTRYLLAELFLEDGRTIYRQLPLRNRISANPDEPEISKDAVLRTKAAGQVWQAYLYFKSAGDDWIDPDAEISLGAPVSVYARFARFGQAECLFELGEMRPYAPPAVPKADACWEQAARIYQDLSWQQDSKVEALHAMYWLALCQLKRNLMPEMRETLRRALLFLDDMADADFIQKLPARQSDFSRQGWRQTLQSLLNQHFDGDRSVP